jgi:hypothetical protein
MPTTAVQALWAIIGDTVVEFASAQFASGTINPIAQFSIASAYTGYTGLAFDASGNLWISEDNPSGGGSAGQIVKYSSAELAALATTPNPAPVVTLAIGGFAEGIAFDQSGNLWASVLNDDTGGQFQKFTSAQIAASGTPTPAVTLLQQQRGQIPGAFVFGNDGTLWFTPTSVIFGPVGGTIYGLSPGQLAGSGTLTPAYTLSDTNAPELESGQEAIIVGPNQVAFDAAGNLWSIFDGYCFAFSAATLHNASPAPLYGFQAFPSQQGTGVTEELPFSALAFDATNDLIIDNGGANSARTLDELTSTQYAQSSSSPLAAQYASTVPAYTSGLGDFIIRGPYVALGAVSASGSRSK